MRAAIITLGCKANQFESQAMERLLSAEGVEIVAAGSEAEIYIVNTCTVTGEADRKSRQALKRARTLAPHGTVGLCGCFGQLMPQQKAALTDADVISGNRDHAEFIDKLLQSANDRNTAFLRSDCRDFRMLPAGGAKGHTRALLKIEDGCKNFCTYCIIPYARGPVRSLPPEKIRSEATELAKNGYREIVLTGIEISSYGADLENASFCDAVAAVCESAPDARIRLGSLEPTAVDENFCAALVKYKNLCPHFHLSLQSGSDEILRKMRRKYDTARFSKSLSLLRDAFEGCNVTTDVICGFPGETAENHRQSLEFVSWAGFGKVHVFPYSPREGTPAAKMPDRVDKTEKTERCRQMNVAAAEAAEKYMNSLVGSSREVLFETKHEGYTDNYIYVTANRGFEKNTKSFLRLSGLSGEGMSGLAE